METRSLAARAPHELAESQHAPDDAPTSSPKLSRHLGQVIFYGLLAVIALAAVPYGTVHVWSQSLYGCLVLLLAALACVEIGVSRAWPRSEWLWLMLPLAGLLVLMLTQTIPLGAPSAEAAKLPQPVWWALSNDPYETRRTAWRLLVLMLTGALLFRYTNSPQRLRVLVGAVVLIVLGSALFALARMAGQSKEGFFLPRLPLGEKRAGQFINRNHFAFMLEMGLGLLVGLLAARGLRREKWPVLLGPAFLIWAVLVLSASRGGLLAFVAQVVFLGLLFGWVADKETFAGRYLGQSWAVRGVLLLVLLLGLGVGSLWLGGDDLASRLQQASTEISNEQAFTASDKTNRAEMWRATWQMFKDNPLVGTGLGAYWSAIPHYHQASGRLVPRQAHNDYLEILASVGIIGFALAVGFVALFVRQARRRLASHDSFRRAACFGALVGLFGVAVHSLLDFGLHLTINTLLFICLVVIATAGAEVTDRHTHAPRRDAAPRRLGSWAYAVAVLGAAFCLWGVWNIGRIGFSRLLSDYARLSDGRAPVFTDAANWAVKGTPNDPEAHSGRGLALLAQKRYAESLPEFARAAALRPRDYLLWLQLGRAYDIAGKTQEAVAPFREAQRLAPYYGEPSWQLGNLLYRNGDVTGGFAEIRRAGRSNPDLLPQFIDLAWGTANGDVAQATAYIQPTEHKERLAYAQYLLAKKHLAEANEQIRAAGQLSPEEHRGLLPYLFGYGSYVLAYQSWRVGQSEEQLARLSETGGIVDGDFENDIHSGETYFGWQWDANEGLSYARDPNQPQNGQFSFRIEYKNPGEIKRPTLGQIVAVEPKTRYRLSLAVRGKMTTAGLPLLYVADMNQIGIALGSAVLQPSDAWRGYTLEFTTGPQTTGFHMYLAREKCDTTPCPIYGTLWLDNVTLKKI